MIERWAMIKDGLVVNVCLWNGSLNTWQPPEGIVMIKAPDNIGIGWSYDPNTDTWAEPIMDQPPADPI